MKNETPVLGITMGDPAGVGPEIIAGAWPLFFDKESGIPASRPIVFGQPEIMRRAVELRAPNLKVVTVASPEEALENYNQRFGTDTLPCFDCCSPDVLDWFEDSCRRNKPKNRKVTPSSREVRVPIGEIDARCGDAAFRCLNRAIDYALSGGIDAIVTGPLHKKSLNLAGHNFPGHTEILASRCGIDDFAMMLYLGAQESLVSKTGLAVVHVTLHTAMSNVFRQITKDAVVAKTHLINDFMSKIKGSAPKIGVCALNCHNGEEGLFGREEIDIIRPAVEQSAREGVLVKGPFPSDTLMLDAKMGVYDGIVAMFHDQGHIAVKLLDMHHAVNITLGLPIIRTSVAHGTAFDRAWHGEAKITSLLEAVRVALLLNRGK